MNHNTTIAFLTRFIPLALAGLSFARQIPAQTAAPAPAPSPSSECLAVFSSTGSSAIAEGSRVLGDLRGRLWRAGVSWTTPSSAHSTWSIGGDWQRFEFDPPSGAPLPDSLAALCLKLGYNRQLTPQWSLRATIEPGRYSDGDASGSGAFSVPATLRLLYAVDQNLLWIAGLDLDPRSGTPILGGGGLRWRFADSWTLLLVVPTPEIEYALNPAVTLFAAGGWRSLTFRLADDFGRRRGRPLLDGQDVGYREIDATAGVRWQIAPHLNLRVAAGWTLDRRFQFDDRDLLFNGDGAPAFQLSLSGRF